MTTQIEVVMIASIEDFAKQDSPPHFFTVVAIHRNLYPHPIKSKHQANQIVRYLEALLIQYRKAHIFKFYLCYKL